MELMSIFSILVELMWTRPRMANLSTSKDLDRHTLIYMKVSHIYRNVGHRYDCNIKELGASSADGYCTSSMRNLLSETVLNVTFTR